MDKEKLQRGLGLFLDAMRPYAVSVIQRDDYISHHPIHVIMSGIFRE